MPTVLAPQLLDIIALRILDVVNKETLLAC